MLNFLKWSIVARNFKICVGGTFESLSSSFYRECVTCGELNVQSSPLIHCPLLNKTEKTYVCAPNLIKTTLAGRNISFLPDVIQIDFEAAAFNAITIRFPSARIVGCFIFILENLSGGVPNS